MRKNLVVIILLCLFFNIEFIKAETNAYLTRTTYDNIYFVENGLPEYYMSDIQFHLSFDGKTAFCLDPTLQIKGHNYAETDLLKSSYDNETLNYLNKLIYYGYDYTNHGTPKYYMATQALIWERLSPYVIEFYTKQYGYGDYIDVSNEKNEILFLVNNHENVPYFANKSYNYNLVSNLEFKDDLLKDFEIIDSNYNDVKIEENKLKISNLDGFIGTINIKLKKKTYKNDEAKYYYLMDSQPMMTGGKLDDLIINLSINITGSKIKLNKLDNDSKLPIKNSNIVFNIKNIDTNEYIYLNGSKNLKISNDGYLITDYLPSGTYEIKEVKTENDYKLNSNSKLVKIDEKVTLNNEILEVNFYNDKELGKLEITKIDSTSKKKIENVEFELYAKENIVTKDGIMHYKKGQTIFTKKTDKNGKIVFDNLVLGNYCIKEISTLNDYELNIEEHCFNLYENKNINITIQNELKKGLVEIKKYGENYNYLENKYDFKLLENIEFEIYANNDIVTSDETIHYKKNEIIDTKKTNENGIIIFDNLVLGNYCIREKYTNNNYIKNDKDFCFNLYDNINQNIEVYNYLKKVNIKINKLDSDSKLNIRNSNVVFNLKNIDTNEYLYLNNEKNLEINEEGVLIINNLPYGIYELEEIKTNDEYKLNKQKQIIEINDNTNLNNDTLEINFYNEKKLGKIEITKIDNISKNKMPNVEFELYSKEDIITKDGIIHYKKGKIIDIKKTDKYGKIIFDNLILGKYCIKEVKALEDYKLNAEEYCFNLHENKINNIIIENELKKFKIKIKKYGEKFNYITKEYSFNLLENIEFEIYASSDIITSDGKMHYEKGETIEIKKTDENGIIVFDNLVLGKYCVREKNIPQKYIENDKEYCFDLNENKTVEIYNYLKKSKLRILKIDSLTHDPLEDVEFEIFRNEQSLGKYTTNGEGIIELGNLPVSIYEIKELVSKEGYILNEESYTIDLNLNEEIIIENDKIIDIPNAMKNDYTNVLASTIYIFGIVLFAYEERKNN